MFTIKLNKEDGNPVFYTDGIMTISGVKREVRLKVYAATREDSRAYFNEFKRTNIVKLNLTTICKE